MAADGASLPDAQSLFDDAACGLLVTDKDGAILRANRTFCRWIDRTPEELVGRLRLQDLLTMGGRIFHQTHWAPLLRMQGSVAEVKLQLRHRDGRAIPVMLNAVQREHGGRTLHELALFVAEDRHRYEQELLLARRRAEDLLGELNRQRALAEDRARFAEQMVGIVSHDLRNPLSAIRMSAHLLGRGELTANQITVLNRIVSATARADRLIAELLDFTAARLGQGLHVSASPIDLHALIADCVAELALSFPGHPLEHRRRGDGACEADADRLVQLVGNLVANAMAYGAAGRPVVVTSDVRGDGFAIEVHNEGPPVPEALLPRLFEPMSRGPGASPSGGVGLGLFIVKEIVRAHGGQVEVASSIDRGTTFTARFPK